jgi:hypothetical protein
VFLHLPIVEAGGAQRAEELHRRVRAAAAQKDQRIGAAHLHEVGGYACGVVGLEVSHAHAGGGCGVLWGIQIWPFFPG